MKSKMKRRMLAIVLCMVIALSNSSFIFASSGTEEPAAVAQEGDPQNVQETQTEAAVQDTPAVLSETTPEATPEATPEPTQVPEVTAAPTEAPQATAEPTQAPEVTAAPEATPVPTEAPAVTVEPTQAPEVTAAPETTPEATPVPTEAPVTYNEAVELKHEFKDENGNVTATVTAQIPAGAFQADASELTMEVTVPDQATTEHVKKLMEESLPEHYMLGDTVLYDIRFKVNGTETESQQPIVITFENQNGITVKDVKKAVVFQLDPADPAVEGDKDELVTITQKNDMIEYLQNSGQSTDNVDAYDLSEITLKEDGTSDKIQMEGRTSTIYGCYAYYEPVQVLTYEDDQVTVTVSAAENGVIPANAELKVVPITEDKETEDQYKDVEKKLQEKAEEEEYEIAGFLAYDITFVDPDGNETEPNGEVKVSINYNEAAIPESISEEDAQNAEVTVMHLEEDENGDVAQVVDMAQVDQMDLLEKTDDQKIQKVEVKTESFSTFTITWTTTGQKVTVHHVNTKYQEIVTDTEEVVAVTNQEIILSQYRKDIPNYTSNNQGITIGDGTGKKNIYSMRVNENNILQYKSKRDGSWSNWTSDLGYDVYLIYSATNSNNATIETVDNNEADIKLNLFNYDVGIGNSETSTYHTGINDNNGFKRGINANHDFKFLSDASNNQLAWYNKYVGSNNPHRPVQGIVQNTLVNEYPHSSGKNGAYFGSLDYLFDSSDVTGKQSYMGVNYLFTKDADGYYTYDSDKNAAKLNTETKEFSVYDSAEGGFFPFNKDWVDDPQPNRGGDHYFGMTMSATFYYPKDGKINGNDMIFEFSGDDDVWVFIDNKLVLDIGGIHQEVNGTINFAEKKVEVQGVDGSKDLEEIIGELTPYSTHTIKFFYLERGNSYSNCMLKFNLPTIPEDSVMVTKEVTGEDGTAVDYAEDINYEFILKKNNVALNNAVYDIFEHNEKIGTGTTDANGKFTLKHGQSAVFGGFAATDKYTVTETGAHLTNGYDIEVNDGNIELKDGDGNITDVIQSVSTPDLTVHETPSVVFQNQIKEEGTLTIEKKFNGEGDLDKNFEVELKINGKLYSGSYKLNGSSKSTVNGRMSLRAGEKITIEGFPYGTSFEVREVMDGSYLPTYSVSGDGVYECQVPDDSNEFHTVTGKLAGDGTVTITNTKVSIDGGMTKVTATKTWEDGTEALRPNRVEVTLYYDINNNGKWDEGDVEVTDQNIDPQFLQASDWTAEWNNLKGDKNYVVKETPVDDFVSTVEYTDTYETTSLEFVPSCSSHVFNLTANNMLLVKTTKSFEKKIQWILWTPVDIGLSNEEALSIAEELDAHGNVDQSNFIYAYGESEVTYMSGVHLEETETGWQLSFDGACAWAQFTRYKYNRFTTAAITNTLNTQKTTDISVTKEWVHGTNPTELYPSGVTVKLLAQANNQTIQLDGVGVEQVLNDSNNWQYTYQDLPYYYKINETYYKIDYSVTETKIGNFSIISPEESCAGYVFEVTGNADEGFVITNIYVADSWKIKKVSSTNENHPLSGAKFTLTRQGADDPSYYGMSEADGIVKWWEYDFEENPTTPSVNYILDGTYTLQETKAPVGYELSSLTWTIVIENYAIQSIKDSDNNEILPYSVITRAAEGGTTYLFKNKPLYDLPSAGGSGIFWYLISGTAFLMAASLILYRMKRKEVLGK